MTLKGNTMATEIITDGFSQAGYIAPVKGVHAGLRFTFRPATRRERQEFVHQSERLSPKDADERITKLLTNKLQSWDVTSGGTIVQPSAANALKLPPLLLDRLLLLVLGQDSSDDDPEATAGDKAADAADKFPGQ